LIEDNTMLHDPLLLYDPLGVGDSIMEWIQNFFDPQTPVETAINIWNGFMNLIVDIVKTNPYEFTIDGVDIISTIQGYVGDGIKAIATSILVLVWVVGILRAGTKVNSPMHDPLEVPMKILRLIIAEGLIMSYDYFVSLIFELGAAAVNAITSTGPANFSLGDTSIFEATHNGTQLLFWLMAVGLLLNVMLAGIKVTLSVFGRLLKIYIVIFLAPIALAFYGSEKTEQNAIKYLEGVGSLSLQAVVIVLAITIYMVIATNSGPFLEMITAHFPVGEQAEAFVWFIGQFFIVNLLLALISASEQISERFL